MHAQLTLVPCVVIHRAMKPNLSFLLSCQSLPPSFVHVTITLISREIFHLFSFIYLLSYCSFFRIEQPNNQILLFVQIIVVKQCGVSFCTFKSTVDMMYLFALLQFVRCRDKSPGFGSLM